MSDPMFSDIDETQRKQRVTGLDPDHAVMEQFDHAIDHARVEFYTRLGLATLDALLALTPVDPPTTEAHYRRLIAQSCEQNLIKIALMRWLTQLSKEGNASSIHQEWQDIGAFRELSSREKDAEIDRLQNDIDRALGVLDGSIAIGTPRSRAITINSGTDGVNDTAIECWRALGQSLDFCTNWSVGA